MRRFVLLVFLILAMIAAFPAVAGGPPHGPQEGCVIPGPPSGVPPTDPPNDTPANPGVPPPAAGNTCGN